MRAKDVISSVIPTEGNKPQVTVGANMPVVEVLSVLLDAPGRRVEVLDGIESLGIIDERSLLEGLGKMIASRDDSSIVVIETTPAAFSASRIAMAVEDADTHLVDFWSYPSQQGLIKVTLRVRSTDPSAVATSLRRYDFNVVDAFGPENRHAEVAFERLLELKALLNV